MSETHSHPIYESPSLPEGKFYVASGREPWSPTPNNPFNLTEADGRPYLVASLGRIEDIFKKKKEDELAKPRAEGFRPEIMDFMRDYAYRALIDRCTHNMGIDGHSGKTITSSTDTISQALFYESCTGAARPTALLESLIRNPELRDSELAKRTHPFEWEEAAEMDQVVADAVRALDSGAVIYDRHNKHMHTDRSHAPRTKLASRFNSRTNALEAIIVERKRLFAAPQRDGRRLFVIKNSSILIDSSKAPSNLLADFGEALQLLELAGDEKDEMLLRHKADAFRKISIDLEEDLSKDISERSNHYQPVTTCYYALAAANN